MMSFQVLFFDMGGTIDTYRFTRELRIANAHFFRETLSHVGISLDLTDEKLADLITHGMEKYHRWNLTSKIEIPTLEIWSEYVFKNYTIDRRKLSKITEELSTLYEMKFYNRKMRPELPEVLKNLKAEGYKIGCISNTQSLNQVPLSLKNYGIIDYFDPIVLSSRYGRRKPDPSIFYQAAQQANVPTGSCVYIGDKISRDILGAKRAGFALAIQIVHEYCDDETDEGSTPNAVIHDMRELLPILIHEQRRMSENLRLNNNRKVKAIFFDAGDILYHRPEKDSNFLKFLEGKKTNPPQDLETQKSALKNLAYAGKIRRSEYFEKLTRLYGIKDPNEVVQGIDALRLDENTFEIIDGVPETINILKQQGYILAIITDTAMPFSKKLDWFEQFGFGHVWDAVISSKEIGVRKPSPAMYEKAIAQTGVRPDEAVFVGHRASELKGAKAVGLNTIGFNYDPDAVADVYIKNFRDLLEVSLLSN